MALRNQPYLPLYVKDFLTDEKLIECSAETTGVYIRLMCIMHNSENYGQLKLSDKYNDEDQIKNYSNMLLKQMPYTYEVIYKSLEELLKEKVIFFDKKVLTQKRMFNDGLLSKERANAGRMGGKHSKQNASKTASKSEANTENENEVVIDNNNNVITDIISYMNNVLNTNYKSTTESTKRFIKARLNEGFTLDQFKKVIDKKYNEWGQDKTMAKFLRPETLFGTKFESYLNQQEKKKTPIPEWLGKNIESTIDKTENKEFKEFIEEFRKE